MTRAFFALLGILCFARPAGAATFEQEVERGIDEYTAGQHKEAVATLNRAVRMGGDNTLLARAHKFIAATRMELGDRAAAVEAIHAALKLNPATTFDPDRFPRPIVDLFREVRRAFVGKLVVKCDRDDAVVQVVGHETGVCGREFELTAGKHKVRVTAGGKTETRDVFVDRGGTKEITVRFLGAIRVSKPEGAEVRLDGGAFKPVPFTFEGLPPKKYVLEVRRKGFKPFPLAFRLGAGEVREVSPVLDPETVSVVPVGPIREAPRPALSKWRKVAGWVLVGVGIAALIAGTVNEAGLASQYPDDYYVKDVDWLNTQQKLSWVYFGTALLTGAAGVLTLTLPGSKPRSATIPGGSLGVGLVPGRGKTVSPAVKMGWAF